MVLFSDNTVKIVRIDDLRGNNKKFLPKKDPSKPRPTGEPWNNRWQYATIRFTEYDQALCFYKKVVSYMVELTSTNDVLKYSTTFQVAPVVVRHMCGNNYILLRIRTPILDVSSKMISVFNERYKDEMFMMTENAPVNIEYFQVLYTREYLKKKPSSPDAKEEVRYATMSSAKEPPPPPMPRFLIPGLSSPPGFPHIVRY